MAITTTPPSFGVGLSSSLFGVPVYNDLVTLDTRVTKVDTPFSFRLSLTGTSVTSGADTRITWTNTVSSNGVTISSSNRVTLNRAGRWKLRLSLRYPSGGTGGTEAIAAVRRYDNSNTIQEILANGGGSASNGVATCTACGSMIVSATDYVEAWAFQASTVSKTPEAGPTVGFGWTMFEGYWVATA